MAILPRRDFLYGLGSSLGAVALTDLLAADESTATMTKRLASINVESTEEARRDFREMLFRTEDAMKNHISGVILFDETLRDNILMGETGVSDERLQAVVKAAYVDEFLDQLPDGLESRVGPRGSSLSGGQRQRVAIARALLRTAPILLLDEATSALDARSERLVQEALDRLSEGRTTIVIAHRLATVRNADKIVVMEAGRVIEEGSHEELLARGGQYHRLYELQYRDDVLVAGG